MSIPFVHPFQENQLDIFDWYPKFLSCVRYFLDHAQHSGPVQTVAAFINIKLPSQKTITFPNQPQPPTQPQTPSSARRSPTSDPQPALLIPYIRRLVATSFDSPAVLHGFFGDDWQDGIGTIHESERRNYLFAAKSDTWLSVKSQYDMEDGQSCPFLRPLQNVSLAEIEAAEANWSEWLAMQDWMLGPRAPTLDVGRPVRGTRVKNERP